MIALVIPLGLDTFAISAALGLAGIAPGDRLRLSGLFTLFEAGMPLVGLAIGAAFSKLLGPFAEWIGVAILVALGVYMLRASDEDEHHVARLLDRASGIAVLGLGLSISLDELAIGFTLGLVAVPVLLAIGLIGAQAFAVAQLGFRLGSRVGERGREVAERAAALILILIGLGLAAAHATGMPL